MQGGNVEDNTIIVILIVLALVILGYFGYYFFVELSANKRRVKGGAGISIGFRKEGYRSGEGVLGTEAEARGITALTAHTPPVLRPYELR